MSEINHEKAGKTVREWITPAIRALIDGAKTPQQMSDEQLLIAAVPISEGTAELGFVVEYGSSIARAYLACREPVEVETATLFGDGDPVQAYRTACCKWNIHSGETHDATNYCPNCGRPIKWKEGQ